MKSITLAPIGTVRCTREKIEDDHWDSEKVSILLDEMRFTPDALTGLTDFSHVEILFYLNQIKSSSVELGARHPRGNLSWPRVGIFAQRGKNRPNQIGATVCKILKVDGNSLFVEGLDAVDGTPVLDIKPWVMEFGPRGDVFQPSWISELMKEYW